MNKALLISAAAVGMFAAMPANAATVVSCSGNACVPPPNVNLDGALDVSEGTGLTPAGSTVNFTSSEASLIDLVTGAAQIIANDGNLSNLAFSLENATFTSASFNLQLGGGTGTATISVLNTLTNVLTPFNVALTSGENRFLVSANLPGEALQSVTVNLTSGDLDRFEQLRIAGDNAPLVPEPSTWAMMLVGFGLLGGAMRRKGNVKVSGRMRFA